MKINKLFALLGSLLIPFAFTSCNDNGEVVQSWSYDEALFNQMEAGWENLGLSDYSFEYSVSDFQPDAVTGSVTVTEGTGSVDLTVSGLTSGEEGYEEELNRYAGRNIKINFTSIDEFYSYVKFVVNSRKQEYDSKDLVNYSLSITYDSETFVPLQIEETLFYKDELNADLVEGLWNGSLFIKINNFSVHNELK